MIRINLLPIKLIKKRIKSRNELLGFIALFLIVIGAIGFVGYTQIKKIEDLQAQVEVLQAEKKRFESVINRIKKIQKEQELLETKMKVIENLKVNSQLPVRVLDEVARLVQSDRMWLLTLAFKDDKISLAGIAMDNATIAQFMKRMNNSSFFFDPDLKSTSLTTVSNQKLKSFSLSAMVKKPDFDTKPEKEKK